MQTKASNSNTTATTPAANVPHMNLGPSHYSSSAPMVRRRKAEAGTQPGVTVEVQTPDADFVAQGSGPTIMTIPTGAHSEPAAPKTRRAKGSKGHAAPKPADVTPQPVVVAPTATPAVTVPKRAVGIDREALMAFITRAGLPVREAGSASHAGNPKGTRVVVPRGKAIRRLYAYQLEDATVIGYRTPEQRKAESLGKVSNVADVSTMEQAEALVRAVASSLGITLKLDGSPAKKTGRKADKATEKTGGQS